MEGFGPQATAVAFDMNTISHSISIDVPSDDTLLGIDSNEKVVQATEQQNNEFSNANFVVLPPFLSVPYIQSNTRDPATLLVETVSLITTFDNANPNLTLENKARTQAINVLKFLWCAAKNHLDPLEFVSDRDDLEVEVWGKVRHATCILQDLGTPGTPLVPTGLPPVISPAIQELAGNVREQATILEKMRQDKSNKREEKKQRFDKLHDSTKNMILQASSEDGEAVPSLPAETCQNFYEKTTVAKAMDYLKITMKDKFNCSVDISTGLVTALYTGNFVRERDDAPCNFSFFMVPKLKPLSSGFQNKTTFLQLKATQGLGWDNPDIKEAIKQGIVTPNIISEFKHQLKNFWGLSSFFFGEKALLSKKLAALIQLCHRHSISIEACLTNDVEFCTKLGYCIDNHVYRWLESCMRASEREEVNDALLYFLKIVDSILLDSFHQNLPATFSTISKIEDPEKEHGGDKKRRKKDKGGEKDPENENGKPTKVENTGTLEDWLCTDNNEFKEKFAGKNPDMKPKINGKPACTRFHTKGFCYTNCRNIKSHVPSNELSADVKTKYGEYVTLCKA